MVVQGTEIPVYEEMEMRVEVKRSQLRSVIHGGVLRQVSRYSTFTLDGTASENQPHPLK